MGMPSQATIDRKVRQESKWLVREARALLMRGSKRLPKRVLDELEGRTSALEQALARGDAQGMRAELGPLDVLIDEHSERKSTVREYSESIGIAILIALVLRAFVVEAFKIPSGSMIPTMEIGDHIFVNKFLYGVRIPYTRTKFFEFRKPKRGEVVVFINPCQPDKDFIKRIVAVGGDTVEVRCNLLYVNGEAVPQTLAAESDECSYWDLGGTPDGVEKECSLYVETMDGVRYETLYDMDRPAIDRRRHIDDPRTSYLDRPPEHDFPRITEGMPEMPRCENDRGSTTLGTAALGTFEDSYPERERYKDLGVCAPRKRYRVPEGHVFVMGDNRDDSSDSRSWGVVPLENIKGKALFIWWSKKPGGSIFSNVSWERLGKVVH